MAMDDAFSFHLMLHHWFKECLKDTPGSLELPSLLERTWWDEAITKKAAGGLLVGKDAR